MTLRRLHEFVTNLGLRLRDGVLQPLADRSDGASGFGCFRIGGFLLGASVLLSAGLNLLGDPMGNAGRRGDAVAWLAVYWVVGASLCARLLNLEARASSRSGVVVDHGMRSDHATFAFVVAIVLGLWNVGLDFARAVAMDAWATGWRPTLWNVLDDLSSMVVPYLGCLFGGCEWRRRPPVRRASSVAATA